MPKFGVWDTLKALHFVQKFLAFDSEVSTLHLRQVEWHCKHLCPKHINPVKQSSSASHVFKPFLLLIKKL